MVYNIYHSHIKEGVDCHTIICIRSNLEKMSPLDGFLEKHQPPEYQETLLILSVAMMKHNGPDE